MKVDLNKLDPELTQFLSDMRWLVKHSNRTECSSWKQNRKVQRHVA